MIYALFTTLRLVLLWIDLFILTALTYILSFIPGKKFNKLFIKIFQYWCKIFVKAINVDLNLIQKNTKPIPPQYILICNHPSILENVATPSLFNAQFVAKSDFESLPILGRITKSAGTMYVNRENGDSKRDIIDIMAETLTAGNNIGLYPEGGCKGKKIFIPFKHGAFTLAKQTNIPILPVFAQYEAQDDFAWADDESALRKIFNIITAKNNRANYYVFDAINPRDFETIQQLQRHIEELYLTYEQRYLR